MESADLLRVEGQLNQVRVDAFALDAVLKQSRFALLAVLLNSTLFAAYSAQYFPIAGLVTWYVMIVGSTLVRGVLHQRWAARAVAEVGAVPALTRRFEVGVFISGMLWGSIGAVFFVADAPVHQGFSAMLLAGLSAGAVSAYAASRRATMAFVLPATLPLAVSFFFAQQYVLMAMVLLFVGTLSKMSAGASERTRQVWTLLVERDAQREELRDAQRDVQQAVMAKSEFLADLSHAIRTPLNGVLGLNELLLTTELDTKQTPLAQNAWECGRTLLKLVDNILDFSKLEAQGLELVEMPFEVEAWTQTTLQLFENSARNKGLELRCDIDPSVPPWLYADDGRLAQIAVSFMDNAVKFTDAGEVCLRLSFAGDNGDEDGPRSGRLRISVRDTGVGISSAKIDSVFEPYAQVPDIERHDLEGAGLGLAISTRLAAVMGGRIWVESEVGVGSNFHFEVPILVTGGVSEPSDDGLASDDELAELACLRVLIVDDNPVNRVVLEGTLEPYGVEMVSVDNGLEACDAVADRAFDLIFMDIKMPRMDGYQATREIRAMSTIVQPTIVALTANALTGDRERCLESGMDDYLTKPIDHGELRRVLRQFCSSTEELPKSVAAAALM